MLQLGNKITLGEPIYKFQNNHSVDFDGVDDFIQLGHGFTYTQHTLSAWIKLSSLSNSHTILSGRDSNTDLIRFWVASSDNKVRFRLGDGSNSTVTNPTALEVDRWYHVVGTYDGTNLKIYVDSVLGNTLAASKNVNVTDNLKIGEDHLGNRFHGKIDELAIWDRALTAAEVTEIYRIKYGANLVQNGNFDELGSELIDNGDFNSNDDWILNDGWSISNGKLIGNSPTSYAQQIGVFESGVSKIYKINFTVSDYVSGYFTILTSGGTSQSEQFNANGDYTIYFDTKSPTGTTFHFTHFGSFIGSIDNVSVKQVDPNDRWTLGEGFSFGDGIASCDGTQSANTDLLYNPAFTTNIGKKFKITFTISNYQAGEIFIRINSGNITTARSSNGTFTEILTGEGGGNIRFRANSNFIGSVTNFMVEEQKYVATNLKLNSGNYKSADPVIVSTKSVNFDADAYLDAGNVGAVKTLSFWFNPDSDITDSSARQQLFGFNGTTYFGIRLGAATGFLTGEVLTVLPNDGSRTATTHTFEAGRWYHVAVVWNDTQEYYDIFINGVARTDLNTGTGVNDPFESFIIGADNETAYFFNGQIDDVGIFNVSLSSDQVIEIYNQGVPSNLATSSAGLDGALTGYWKMGDGTLDEAPLIADQTNATLGSNLVLNGTFETAVTTDEWTNFNTPTTSERSTTYAYEGNFSYHIVSDAGNEGIFATANQFNGDYAVGDIVKVQAFVYPITASSNQMKSGLNNSDRAFNTTVTGLTLNQWNQIEYYVRIVTATNNYLTFLSEGAGDEFYVDNVSTQVVNGNPALMQNTPTIVTDAPLTKIRNYYRMGDGILDEFPLICDMVEPSLGSELIPSIASIENRNGGTITQISGNSFSSTSDGTSGSTIRPKFDFATTSGKTYKLVITPTGSITGTVNFDFFDGSSYIFENYDFTTTKETFFVDNGGVFGAFDGTQTYNILGFTISIKQVNGVAGLMTNMTEADITNDVPS